MTDARDRDGAVSGAMARSGNDTVFVEAPGRLHFGVLDLRGDRGRWFGGVGAAAPGPTLLVSAVPSRTLEVEGEDVVRAAGVARRFLAHFGVSSGARVQVHRTLPRHVGLGSGTQLALAVCRALAEVHGIVVPVPDLAIAVGRARRSAVGTWVFAGGGLVVEGGKAPDSVGCAPLIACVPFPAAWRCVVAIPNGRFGTSGPEETDALARLSAPAYDDVARVAHLVLLGMLPALADGNLPAFGAALSEVQEVVGRWFGPLQNGPFAAGPSSGLVRVLKEWGAVGVGQSSWGPAVYGITDGEASALRLVEHVRSFLGDGGTVHHGPFRSEGARIWYAEGPQGAEPPE